MRILANYGYKTNGDMYSVTFETVGDVPSEHAPQAVDELFRLAKEAVQRQINGTAAPAPQPAPAATQPAPGTGAGPGANGNGRKPQIKEPGLPATSKQLGLIRKLARLKGRHFEDFTDMTKGEASATIDELMAA